ncbi:hypothetical protein G9A89_005700 [Geosiphon pyriformis]|nr:hypothetical protein G9A89_005700 [Geosiphon pyriformis]
MDSRQLNTKEFHFEDENDERTVIITELLDPSYGCYVWPSAIVLSNYIWEERKLFQGKTILELGAGTSLPGLLCASLSSNTHVILTDRGDVPQILENIREGARLNAINISEDGDSNDQRLWIWGLMWGEFEMDGLLGLLNKIEDEGLQIDWILGSDTFYDPKDFEDIISTVAFILTHHSRGAKFLTSYQERSSKRSIQYLLDKYNLHCKRISHDTEQQNADCFVLLIQLKDV